MKVVTTNIRSVKIHTTEPLCTATDGGGGEIYAAATTTTTGNTNIIGPASIRVFEVPAPETLNDESFILVVAHPMAKTPGRLISTFTEADGSVVGGFLDHVTDSSTAEMPPSPPLTRFLPVPIPPLLLPPITAPCTPLLQHRSHVVRPTTRSPSTGEKADCRERKLFEYHYGVK